LLGESDIVIVSDLGSHVERLQLAEPGPMTTGGTQPNSAVGEPQSKMAAFEVERSAAALRSWVLL
jgi:hypothetical protein